LEIAAMKVTRRESAKEAEFLAFCEWLDDPSRDPDEYLRVDGSWWHRSRVTLDAPAPTPAPAPMPTGRLVTLVEAAELVRAAPETVRYWVWQGRLVAYKPGRNVLVREADLMALVAGNETVAKRARKMRKPKG
jgi:excisionase family DNA binding protein